MNEQHYHKKIMGYLDGSLTAAEKSEFEAFTKTHPDFQKQVKQKEDELDLLRSRIPAVQLSEESRLSLEEEIKLSIQHLLKPEKTTLLEKVQGRFEDWFSR
jgi:anti-sigma-K factor RskA